MCHPHCPVSALQAARHPRSAGGLIRTLALHVEIAVALATPIVLLACLGAWAKLLVPFANREGGKRTLSDWPQVWDLVVWILLFQYPPLSCGAS